MMNEHNRNRLALVPLFVCMVASPAFTTEENEQITGDIPRPGEGSHVVDTLNLIDPVNEREINDLLIALEEEKGVPLYVVVIPSMDMAGYPDTSIEDVAKDLMTQWKISPKTLDGKPWDRGVLLVFSKELEKIRIRIETAKGWGKDLDDPGRAVINRVMIPYFKQKKYTLGVTRGVRSLSAAIRMQTRTRPTPPKIPVPQKDEFVIDTAGLLPLPMKLSADRRCRDFYQKQSIPMFVVTATSIEDASRKGLRFEELAGRFFLYWPVGDKARRKAFRKRGVLMFISRNDNLVGLEFGGAWGDRKTRNTIRKDIVVNRILPALKENQLPRGIMSAIQGVEKRAREITFSGNTSPSTATAPAKSKASP